MGYIFVTLVLVLIAASIVVRLVRDKKSGRGGCGGGCGGCPNAPYCHPQHESKSRAGGPGSD